MSSDSNTGGSEREVADPRPLSERSVPSPIIITESRYGGVYSGGRWIITCGIHNPDKTAALGGDTACNQFWSERHSNGPEFEYEGALGSRTVYADAGDDPNGLINDAFRYYGHEISESYTTDN